MEFLQKVTTYYQRSFQYAFGLLMAVLLLVPPSDLSANQIYQALLRGRHEALPVATPASGMITATLEDDVLTVEGSFSGLQGDFAVNIAGGSHIHLGYAGQNGGIELPLTPTLDEDMRGGAFMVDDNTFTLSEDQLQALENRQLYVNIHSTASPSGELRGQLLPMADAYFFSNVLGSNEVPAIMSAGGGALAYELRGNTLTVSGSFQGLEGEFATQIAGGAHLHLGSAGENGGIEVLLNTSVGEDGLSGVFPAADNTFELSPQQVRNLQARRFYANIHSNEYPGGELRGQVLGMARTVFRAHLSGSNEIPAVTSMGTGVVLAELMADGRLITSGSFAGLESQMALNIGGGAHIHRGVAGRNGPVMFRLFVRPAGNLRAGIVRAARNVNTLSDAQVGALYGRGFYVNIHSLRNNSGEIRGQLLPESQMVFNGFPSSIFQTAGQISTASGGIKAELSGNRLIVSGSFRGLSSPLATDIAGGAHIHRAMAGANGPVTQPLVATLAENGLDGIFEAAENAFELAPEDIADLRARRKYVNIHSANFRPGEIRSQLLPEASTYFVAPLSGASQTIPVNTEAVGMAIVELTGNVAVTSGSFNNLSSPLAVAIAGGAHIHGGLAGENGGVIFRLASTTAEGEQSGVFPAADNVQGVNAGFVRRLRSRGTYVNVHSDNFRPGEIRGQLLPLATAYFTATLSGMNSVQPKATAGRGQIKAELRGSELVISGAFSGLTGDFATAVAGGSHLHGAMAGSNGPIRVFTNAELDDDLKGGRFLAEDNTVDLDAAGIEELISGGWYLNLHSTTFLPGEIRGQVLGEINAFPGTGATIEAPASGAALTVSGDGDTPFIPSWSAAEDRDDLAYIWQLSTGVAFENILVNQNVGDALSFETDFATVDALLAAAGLEVGESVTLFHRAVASDGSLFTPGPTASVMLTRGTVGAVGGRIAAAGNTTLRAASEFAVYPTVVRPNQQLNVRIQSEADQQAVLVLVNQLGQPLKRQTVDLFAGDNRMEWALPDLAAGYYFVQLQTEGRLLPLQRIVVGR